MNIKDDEGGRVKSPFLAYQKMCMHLSEWCPTPFPSPPSITPLVGHIPVSFRFPRSSSPPTNVPFVGILRISVMGAVCARVAEVKGRGCPFFSFSLISYINK